MAGQKTTGRQDSGERVRKNTKDYGYLNMIRACVEVIKTVQLKDKEFTQAQKKIIEDKVRDRYGDIDKSRLAKETKKLYNSYAAKQKEMVKKMTISEQMTLAKVYVDKNRDSVANLLRDLSNICVAYGDEKCLKLKAELDRYHAIVLQKSPVEHNSAREKTGNAWSEDGIDALGNTIKQSDLSDEIKRLCLESVNKYKNEVLSNLLGTMDEGGYVCAVMEHSVYQKMKESLDEKGTKYIGIPIKGSNRMLVLAPSIEEKNIGLLAAKAVRECNIYKSPESRAAFNVGCVADSLINGSDKGEYSRFRMKDEAFAAFCLQSSSYGMHPYIEDYDEEYGKHIIDVSMTGKERAKCNASILKAAILTASSRKDPSLGLAIGRHAASLNSINEAVFEPLRRTSGEAEPGGMMIANIDPSSGKVKEYIVTDKTGFTKYVPGTEENQSFVAAASVKFEKRVGMTIDSDGWDVSIYDTDYDAVSMLRREIGSYGLNLSAIPVKEGDTPLSLVTPDGTPADILATPEEAREGISKASLIETFTDYVITQSAGAAYKGTKALTTAYGEIIDSPKKAASMFAEYLVNEKAYDIDVAKQIAINVLDPAKETIPGFTVLNNEVEENYLDGEQKNMSVSPIDYQDVAVYMLHNTRTQKDLMQLRADIAINDEKNRESSRRQDRGQEHGGRQNRNR